MASVPETKIVDEIPNSMQKLARFVSRGFYGAESTVVIDLLIRNVCMREDDLRDLLRFDAKQLRAVLISLKQSKIIKERQLVEQRTDNRPIRHNYYFINYRALLNVMKYKVDHMRRKLESEEKTSTHRSTFKCLKCKKPYSDLDINLLWNGDEMQCTFCRGTVEEDLSALPNQSARSSLARFNEQMWPFFQLMQELEGVQLAPHLLEPTPMRHLAKGRTDLNAASAGASANAGGGGLSGGHKKNEFEIYKQGFTVNIEGSDGYFEGATSGAKDVPAWIQSSTVLSPHHGDAASAVSFLEDQQLQYSSFKQEASAFGGFSPKHQDIVNTLLVHEAKSVAVATSSSPSTNAATLGNIDVKREEPANQNSVKQEEATTMNTDGSSEDEADFEEVDDDADETSGMIVNVQGKPHSFTDVYENPDLLTRMTEAEKEHYIRLSQIAFQNMYGD